MYIRTKVFVFFFLILSFTLAIKDVYGITYFSDDFNQDNLENWIFVNVNNSDLESWKIVDNKLKGEVVNGEYSFLLAKNFSNLSDYSIRIDTINNSGVDQDIIFRVSEDMNNYYMLNIRFRDPYWPQDNHGEIVLWKCNGFNCGNYKRLDSFNDLSQINLTQDEVHKIKIEVNGSNIKIYFDSILVIDFDDNNNPLLNGSFGFYNWGGSYYERPIVNLFDNLVVGDFNYGETTTPTPTPTETPTPTPTPTSTPTPTPMPKVKIIILPGLGASWNADAIVYNKTVGGDQWIMTPFVKNYNGLINALKQNDLEENQDFYVWNYDWRRPVGEIVISFNNFLNDKIGMNEKVVLIGHSLGGLVSRIWAEDNKNDLRLREVINLGGPNLGSVNAYEIWNGGRVSDLSNVSLIASKILLKIQGLTTKTDMEAVRKYMPVVKDLLPTFNYVSKNGIILDNSELETNNTFLQMKNNNGVDSGINLKLFVGNNFKTIDSIELKNNNIFDRILGIWPDGRISKFLYSNLGDGSVLVKSANYGKSDFIDVNSDHGGLVFNTVNQVMAEIGLSQVDVVGESQDLDNSLVVFVGSPVDFSVKCDSQSPVDDIDGFVIIKNNNYKSCTIKLVGNGEGLIHIVAGNTNNNDWSYWEKNIMNGEINFIKINPTDGGIINDKDGLLFLKSIIRADINSLLVLSGNNKDLREALKFLDKNQPRDLIRNIFEFRKYKGERIISEKIIDNATIWLSLTDRCSKNRASVGFRRVDNYQNLIDKLILNRRNFEIGENAAISYQKMDEILEFNGDRMEQKDYSKVCANNFTAVNYGNEVLVRSHRGSDFWWWLLEDSDL